MQDNALTPEQEQILIELINNLNERFESAVNTATSQAFNLGCSVGLLPGAIILVLTFFFSHGSLAALMIAALLVIISLLALANLVAYIARSRSITHIYQRQILPEIESNLRTLGQSRSDFEQMAAKILPQGAGLRAFLEPLPIQDSFNQN